VYTAVAAVADRPPVAVADGLQYRYLGQRLLMSGAGVVLDIPFQEDVQIILQRSTAVLGILVFLILPTLTVAEEEEHKPQEGRLDSVTPLNTAMELLVHI